ncbi:Zn-dependent hydrolase [Leuconostoc fallax]|uniref:Peptidase M20 dimerisation domain-containing protein n=2 Tax=Leuconostoc fallax TaxID=1251 RepID=A0A4R5N874_9LACO|nr:Zn-dependent hydrolase [Leuconostoc fallax]MBU7455247.1 Zn-dependent hydrolase [Leuconostoc fallax]MCO6183501.1 Zn-dependent hydrolase [Leuconostoc fallax]TDG67646.1 hypothetical protein C5L23_001445 [Leuconostoc fallax]
MSKITQLKSLITLLNEFKMIGATNQHGVTRCVYDEHWILAQKKYAEIARNYGLYPFVDNMGNVYASTSKDINKQPVILTGSHIDTVINGGSLDGTYGVLSSLTSLGELVQQHGTPKVPIVSVSFSEEEGSRFDATFTGSRYLTNQFDESILSLADNKGVVFETARQLAVTELQHEMPIQEYWNIGKYLELHIEQGPILEQTSQNIGIVTGIVGQKRAQIKIVGQANHAGTTPMNMRHDALRQAIELISNIHECLDDVADLRYTIGQFDVLPNVSNVVPGEVTFSLDMRQLNQDILEKYFAQVENIVHQYQGTIEPTTNVKSTKMSDELQKILVAATEDHELTYTSLPSGAGHDAQVISYKIPTGMIFVPSIDGVSHSPLEQTQDDDLLNGQHVLKKALYKLAY